MTRTPKKLTKRKGTKWKMIMLSRVRPLRKPRMEMKKKLRTRRKRRRMGMMRVKRHVFSVLLSPKKSKH
jgi:hypothetical protein